MGRRQDGVTPGVRTTIGVAGKYPAISDRALRSAAVPIDCVLNRGSVRRLIDPRPNCTPRR
jgi:hypothetical protein